MKKFRLIMLFAIIFSTAAAFTTKGSAGKFANLRRAPIGSNTPCNTVTAECGGGSNVCQDASYKYFALDDDQCIEPLQKNN